MPVLTVGQTEIHYTLRRSANARQARFTVTPDHFELVVPQFATDAEIDAVLSRRRGWLVEERRRMAERTAQAPTIHRFVTGAKIPYRGRRMRLRVEPHDGNGVEITYRNGFYVSYPRTAAENSRDSMIESAFRLWFKARLRRDVREMVRRHGPPNGLMPRDIRIKDQMHLWGSCGHDRILNINWQLIFAPKSVLEYAVVHELCHLRERNHDERFWHLLGSIVPDWEERKIWLDTNEQLLAFRVGQSV